MPEPDSSERILLGVSSDTRRYHAAVTEAPHFKIDGAPGRGRPPALPRASASKSGTLGLATSPRGFWKGSRRLLDTAGTQTAKPSEPPP